MTKPELERMVAEEFLGLVASDVSLVESREPPEPDIRYFLDGTARYLELMQATDPTLEQSLAEYVAKIERGLSGYSGAPYEVVRNLGPSLLRKLSKTYRTEPENCQIDLLVYLEGNVERDLMSRLDLYAEDLDRCCFSKVWFYDRHYGIIGAVNSSPLRVLFDACYQAMGFRVAVAKSARRNL